MHVIKNVTWRKMRLNLEQEKIRLQHEIVMARASQPRNQETSVVSVEKPKLPQYRDCDDIQSFFYKCDL